MAKCTLDPKKIQEAVKELAAQECEEQEEAIYWENGEMSLDALEPFPNHPFAVKDDADMDSLIASIRENGILEPLQVAPIAKNDVRYMILSGHRRQYACQKLGITRVPVRIFHGHASLHVDLMLAGNQHRPRLLPSEIARALALKMDSLRHQGRATSGTQYLKFTGGMQSRDHIGISLFGITGSMVSRYIRLTYLIPPLLQRVDNGMSITIGYKLSMLSRAQQQWVEDCLEAEQCSLSMGQVETLKKNKTQLTQEFVEKVIAAPKPNQRPVIRLSLDCLPEHLQREGAAKEIQDYVIKAVQYYQEYSNAKPTH